MATSGDNTYGMNRNEILTEAMRTIGHVGGEETPSNADIASANRSLNLMLQEWQNLHIGLWLNQEVTLFLIADRKYYSLGLTGDHCTASHTETTLSAAASSGAAYVMLTDTTSLLIGTHVGIELDSGSVQWTTLLASSVGGITTLNAALAGSAASGNSAFTYSTKISRPLEIIEARFFGNNAGTDRPLDLIAKTDYQNLATKDSSGKVTQYAYDPKLTNGRLYVWPVCDDEMDQIRMTVKTPIDKFVSANDDAQFPEEWQPAIIYGLAARLIPKFGKKITPTMQLVLAQAAETFQNAKTFDTEDSSIRFVPDIRD